MYPCLLPPNWDLPFHVYCDASEVAVGSALCQPIGENQKIHPIAFVSRQLIAAKQNYSTTECECLAMVFNVKKFRHYLLLNLVVFFVDHMALRYLVNKLDLSGRLARWIFILEEFDYTMEYKPGHMHKQADHLLRLSKDLGSLPLEDDLPDASLFAINVVPHGITILLNFLAPNKCLWCCPKMNIVRFV
jgi:hypothetical protein